MYNHTPKYISMTGVISSTHQKVFNYLLAVNEHFHLNVVLRVAGGWVRDMLLGMNSNDIDIALESPGWKVHEQSNIDNLHTFTVSGETFARAVAEYQILNGEKSRTVSVIRTNPALSKHIETATICVCDVPVEFCALRADVYDSTNSRIPSSVRSASPKEDAERRDFTINALFYNLHTKQVEDYTSGLTDLSKRLLRCPLSPLETFRDDPLRLLRGVRFVGQLGELSFMLDRTIVECVSDEIYTAMEQKVSRERIGKEVAKMLTSSCPLRTIEELNRLDLLNKIVLVEFYVKDKAGKRTITPSLERCVRMTDYFVEEPIKKEVLAEILWLCKIVIPLIKREENSTNMNKLSKTVDKNNTEPLIIVTRDDEQIALLIFLMTLPFFCRNTSLTCSVVGGVNDSGASLCDNSTTIEEKDGIVKRTSKQKLIEWEERLYALCINGLKLPVTIYHTVKNMLQSYHILSENTHHLKELFTNFDVISNDNKIHIADALAPLNNAHSFNSCFKIVLLSYYLNYTKGENALKEETMEVLDVVSAYRNLWATLEGTLHLLNVHTFQLPMKGSDLRTKFEIPAKDVGSTLVKMRYLILLHPEYTLENLEDWLSHLQSSQ